MRKKTRKGATSTEYLFCAVLIIVAMLASIAVFGSATKKTLDDNSTQLEQVFQP